MSQLLRRLPRTIALAVIIGIGVFNLYQAVTGWTLSDAGAYWNAAMRLREGQDLYPAVASVDASDVYRYAPWFAWLTVPVTYLPGAVAGTLWSALLLAASGAALIPLVRVRAWVLVALFGPILVGISAVGNVHALIIAVLLWSVQRRAGPLAIAVAASLKIFPLLLALVYAGRQQWGRFGVAVLLTGLLWAPVLLYNLDNYAVEPGQAASLSALPILYVIVAGVGVGVTLALVRTRFGWLAAATTLVVALPRLFVYDVSFLMVGAVGEQRSVSRPRLGRRLERVKLQRSLLIGKRPGEIR